MYGKSPRVIITFEITINFWGKKIDDKTIYSIFNLTLG